MAVTWKCPWCAGDNVYRGASDGDSGVADAFCAWCGLPLGDPDSADVTGCAVVVAPGVRCPRQGVTPWVNLEAADGEAPICAEHAAALEEIRNAAAEARGLRQGIAADVRAQLMRPGSATREMIEDIQRRHSAAHQRRVSQPVSDVDRLIDLACEEAPDGAERSAKKEFASRTQQWAEELIERSHAHRQEVEEWRQAEEERLAAERAEERRVAFERTRRWMAEQAEEKRLAAEGSGRAGPRRTAEDRRLEATIARRRWKEKAANRKRSEPDST